MAEIIWQVRSLNPWLKRVGASRGGFIVDRLQPGYRYVFTRGLPDAGESTGQILVAIDQGHLVQVEAVSPSASSGSPSLQLVAGDAGPSHARRRSRLWIPQR